MILTLLRTNGAGGDDIAVDVVDTPQKGLLKPARVVGGEVTHEACVFRGALTGRGARF